MSNALARTVSSRWLSFLHTPPDLISSGLLRVGGEGTCVHLPARPRGRRAAEPSVATEAELPLAVFPCPVPKRGNAFYYSERCSRFDFFFSALAGGILVPRAWIEPRPSAVRAQSPDRWVCRHNHVLTGQHVESPQETPRRLPEDSTHW